MRASTDSIGVFFDFNDIGNASLAQEVAFNEMGRDRLPASLAGAEIIFPVLLEGEEVLLDAESTEKIITLARIAFRATDQRQYEARYRYTSFRHNGANDDLLIAASLENRLEEEFTEVFRGLSEQALACITESADVVIDRGLNNNVTSS